MLRCGGGQEAMHELTGFVAYLDVLGFSNLMKEKEFYHSGRFSSNYRGVVKILREITQGHITLGVDRVYSNEDGSFGRYIENEIRFSSDSIFICNPKPTAQRLAHKDGINSVFPDSNFIDKFDAIVRDVSLITYSFLQKGYLVRGGVSYGSYYYEENILLGGALVRAVAAESIADKPLIELDDCALAKLNEYPAIFNVDATRNSPTRVLQKDSHTYIDWLYCISCVPSITIEKKILNMVQHNIDKLACEKAKAKWEWMQNYLLETP